jgi:hypothetical protein
MSQTNYLEVAINNHMFGGPVYAPPTQWWVSIYQANPGDNPGLGITPELGLRVQVTSWNRQGGSSSNVEDLLFSQVPALTTWVITHFTVWDSETGGNSLYTGPLSAPQTRSAGQRLVINSGNLVITQD